ncbi:ProQ/FINO family protein [Halomonas sp. NO4]|uniref:ProQ/FINO family protein n=1 Tax=Halomonas sp. NO4 TaxID=2484813 RepID=UPI001F09AA79|nr:ProQ/FINO family protein [Halomonas sp. NO4]
MIEERSHRLLAILEERADAALIELAACRRQLRELQGRLSEYEAMRLELTEENRELGEQNRELEEDNARLRERLQRGEPMPATLTAPRRAQGLSALIGHRPRAASPAPPEPEATAAPAGDAPASHEASESQPSLAIDPAPSPDALLAQWYQRYPQTFFKGHTRPLKVGIHLDLAAREPWPEKLVRRALAGYVNLPRYLKGVREGAERIGLDGQPHGQVDAEAAEHAHRKLERLQAERDRRGGKTRGAAGKSPSKGTGKAGRRSGREPAAASTPAKSSPTKSSPTQAAPSQGNGQRQEGSLGAEEASANIAAANPEARLEAKLSALVAKHNGRR